MINSGRKCPDCGAEVGNPHRNDCDVEPCSECGSQRITCGCPGHDPLKVVWTGSWPFQTGAISPKQGGEVEEPGFIILVGTSATDLLPDDSRRQNAAPPARTCSDQMYERNARRVYEECYVEPIFRDGVPTGEYRACRRRSQGGLEQATFATREEAMDWGKRRRRG